MSVPAGLQFRVQAPRLAGSVWTLSAALRKLKPTVARAVHEKSARLCARAL
jgi:hypothetical protein